MIGSGLRTALGSVGKEIQFLGKLAATTFGLSWKFHKYEALFRMFHFRWIIVYFFDS
jgi:hypothetical protein